MRDIRFRGKRIDNGEWVYGGYMHSLRLNKSFIWATEIYHSLGGVLPVLNDYEVDPETVGQYIGVHDDEYENELFEGDIIEMAYQDEKIVCSIQYCDSGFLLASDDFEDGFMWITDVSENDGQHFWIPTAVKIGNMTDDGDRFC